MNKPAILLPIHPKYMAAILNGEKTIEVRKFNLPAGSLVYAYCTKNGGNLEYADNPDKSKNGIFVYDKTRNTPALNGKVLASFVVSESEEIGYDTVCGHYGTMELGENELLKESCLSQKEISDYLGKGEKKLNWFFLHKLVGYGLHVSQLKIFDRPKELCEFATIQNYNKYQKELKQMVKEDQKIRDKIANETADENARANGVELLNLVKEQCFGLKKAPQSYCYVEELK